MTPRTLPPVSHAADAGSADSDALFLAEETDPGPAVAPASPWKVLVVDDEEDVHAVTRLALAGLVIDGRPLQLISARSPHEARVALVSHPDVAVVLLDVIMDGGQTGLDLARWIRDDLSNNTVRIVIRTGQPGAVPEAEVLTRYDVNDYREKTAFSMQALRTVVIGAVRNWRDIMAIEAHRAGLARVVEAATSMLSPEASLTDVLLGRAAALFGDGTSAFFAETSSLEDARLVVQRGLGRFEGCVDQPVIGLLSEELQAATEQALLFGGYAEAQSGVVFGFTSTKGRHVLVVEGQGSDDMARGLFGLVGGIGGLAHERHVDILDLRSTVEAYMAFVPPPLVELAQAGCTDIRKLQPATRAITEAGIVVAQFARQDGDPARFCVVEGLLRDILVGRGGIVVQQTDTRVVVAFPDGAAAATDAALASVDKLEDFRLPHAARCAVGVGPVTVATLGEERPHGFVALGGALDEAITLAQRTASLDFRVAVTPAVRALLRPTLQQRITEIQDGRRTLHGFPVEAPTQPRDPLA